MDNYQVTLIGALFIMILLTRALPFFFANQLKDHVKFQALGRQLPAYIMLLLVVYEVHLGSFLHWPYGIPALLALTLLTFVHLWRRQVFISLAVGTVSYVYLLRLMT